MPRQSRLEISKKDIIEYFDSMGNAVYQLSDMYFHLDTNRDSWRLAKRTTALLFTEFLIDKGRLKELSIAAEDTYQRNHIRFSWGEVSPYLIAVSLKKGSYLCHGTAVYLHGLNDQIPKVTYVNEEQSAKKHAQRNELQQSGLKMAFSRKQRISKMILSDENDNKYIIVNGKKTDGLGVESIPIDHHRDPSLEETVLVTSLERTLIDIVVRPAYAGGIYSVLDAYVAAKERVSVNKLNSILVKLDYTYPYHQAIGFLMEKSGYKKSLLDLMKNHGLEYDFYLSHGMKDTDFNKEWRLHIPRGF